MAGKYGSNFFEKFSYKEKLEIIMGMVKRNIDHGITLKRTTDLYQDFLNSSKKKAEAVEKRKKAEKVVFAHRVLKKHYFDKETSLKKEDIPFIEASLKALGLEEKLCLMFQKILLSKIKAEKKDTPIISVKKQTSFNNGETKRIYHEIMERYSLEEHKTITVLTLPEIIHLVSLMRKINIEEKEIIKFIKTVNKDGLQAYKTWFEKLYDYYEKIEKYSNPSTFEELKESLNNLMIKQSAADYHFYKEYFLDLFRQVLEEIRGVYEYELEKGTSTRL